MTSVVDRLRALPRWARFLAWTLAILVVLRLALAAALPIGLRAYARSHELDADWRSLDLSLLAGDLTLEGLVVRPRPAEGGAVSPPIAELDYLGVDCATSQLLRGRLRVHRVDVDGLRAVIERDANGRWNWERHFPAGEVAQPEPDEERDPSEPPPPLDFRSPLELDALRVQHLVLELRDASVAPPIEAQVVCDVRATDVGSPDVPAVIECDATSAQFLGRAAVSARGRSSESALDAALAFELADLRPTPLAGWLAALGIEPEGTMLSGSGRATLRAERLAERLDACRAELALTELELDSDGVVAATLAELALDAPSLSSERAEIAAVRQRGLTVHAERTRGGVLRFCGLDFVGGGASAAPSTSPPEPGTATHPWSLDEITLADARVTLTDRAVEPAAELELALESARIGALAIAGARPAAPTPIECRLRAPGIAESIEIRGSLELASERAALDLGLAIAGLRPERLAAHLERAGLASTFESGSFAAHVAGEIATERSGRITGSLLLDGIELSDGARLFALERAAVTGLAIEPEPRAIEVGALEIAGLRTSARRDASGTLFACGLRTLPGERPAPAAAPAAAPAPLAAAASTPPARFALGKLSLRDVELAFDDDAIAPPLAVALSDLEVEVEHLTFGAPSAEPGRVHARLAVPGIIGALTVDGSLRSAPGDRAPSGSLALAMQGIRSSTLAPYLAPLGIEPTLADGSLALALELGARDEQGELAYDLALERVSLTEGERSLASLAALRIRGARFFGPTPRADSIEVAAPEITIEREADGALAALGIRYRATAAPAEEPEPDAPASATSATPPALALGSLTLADARCVWRDAAVDPPVSAELMLDARVEPIELGGLGGAPMRFSLGASLPGTIGALKLSGEARLAADLASASGRLELSDAAIGALAPYLPPGVRCELASGAASTDFEARLGRADAGGVSVSARLADLALTDGAAPAKLLSLTELVCDAPRLDPAAGYFDVESLRVRGLAASARRDARGALHALGFELAPAPADAARSPDTPAVAEDPAPRKPLEFARIGALELELTELALEDAAIDAPLVARARLTTDGPQILIQPEASELAPVALHFSGALEPAVRAMDLDVVLAPFAPEPEVAFDLALRGISGDGIVALAPALAGKIDGSELEDGELAAHLVARIRAQRGPRGRNDFTRPFGLELELGEVALKDRGELRASIDGARAEVSRVDPQKGDVYVRTLEIERPRTEILRDAAGIHVAGFTFAPPSGAATEGSPEEAPEQPVDRAPAQSVRAIAASSPLESSAPGAKPATGELRLDRLTVVGLDVGVRDVTVDPPLVLPLDELELELRRFTTRAFTEPIAMQFRAYLASGAVPLPPRAGLSGAPSQASEQGRPVFDELAVTGRVQLYPALSGWTNLSLSALELLSFRGYGGAAGITVSDGLMDSSVRLRFDGADRISVDSRQVFTDLELAEPDGGALSQALGLSMPLNVVLFVLKDVEGQHKVPVSLNLSSAGLEPGEVQSAALGAAGAVLGRAIASSPLRVLTSFTDILGVTGNEPAAKPRGSIAWERGATIAAAGERQRTAALLVEIAPKTDLVIALSHRFSLADIERIATLANPPLEDCRALADRLRQRKAELSRQREELAAEARVEIAIGGERRSEALIQRLRALDRELGENEDALERMCEFLRPNAERRRDQRTRGAAYHVAKVRLLEAREMLVELGIQPERIELRPPRVEIDPQAQLGQVVIATHKREEAPVTAAKEPR